MSGLRPAHGKHSFAVGERFSKRKRSSNEGRRGGRQLRLTAHSREKRADAAWSDPTHCSSKEEEQSRQDKRKDACTTSTCVVGGKHGAVRGTLRGGGGRAETVVLLRLLYYSATARSFV